MPGADDQRLVAEVAARHRLPLGRQLRHGAGDDRARRGRRGRRRAARAGCAAPRRARRPSESRTVAKRQCSTSSVAVERAEVGLGVADVDGEKHRAGDYGRFMANRLYVIPGSHPCAAVEAALTLKGVPYERVDWLPVIHRVLGRAVYGAPTVPGHQARGRKARRLARDHAPARRPGRRARAVSGRCRAPHARSSAPRSGATRSCSRSCAG